MPWKRQDGKNQLQHERREIINNEIKTGGHMPAGFCFDQKWNFC